MRVLGLDATKGGWVGIALDDGRFAGDLVLRPIDFTLDALGDAAVIAIDIPIGFGPRQADSAARAYLTGAASTVFPAPARAVLDVPFGPGLGVSAQSHALGHRMIHVTDIARGDTRIFEVHPEVSFRAMNDERPLRYRKRSSGGALERIDLLRRHGIELDHVSAAASLPLDDVLDAAAAAWSAHRISRGVARSLPDPPEIVAGRRVAIWY